MNNTMDSTGWFEEDDVICSDFYYAPGPSDRRGPRPLEFSGSSSNVTYSEFLDSHAEDRNRFKIIKFLYSVGIPITSIGFYYFIDAIDICINDTLAVTNAQKNIYMVIADEHCVTYKSVERAMRSVFTEAVSLRASRLFENILDVSSERKGESMSLIEFVCLVAFYLRMRG